MNKAINNKNTVLRYIVPFYVEREDKTNEQYEVLVEQLHGANGYELLGDSAKEKDLYKYIYDQIGIGNDTKELGCVYVKTQVKDIPEKIKNEVEKDSEIKIENKDKEEEKIENKPQPINLKYKISNEKILSIQIDNYKIYLFKTGINFFVYDIKILEECELDELEKFQNAFKELVRSDVIKREYNKEDENGKTVQTEGIYRGAEAIHKELTSIFAIDNIIRYYSEREIKINKVDTKVVDKPILFSYVSVLDEDKLSAVYYKSAYYLSTGFTTKYEYNERRMEKVFRPFDNIIWEISKEGCCGLAVVENEKHYLYSDFKTRVKNDYFLLYILVLHQAHVMLDFSNMIARELPADYESYDDGEGKLYETIKKIKLRLNVFLARNVYTSVSHIQHHNEFYDYAVRRLDIEHDIQSVSAGLGALEKTQQMYKEKYEQELKEKEKAQQLEKEKREQELKEKNSRNIKILIAFMTLINTISISLNLNKFVDEIKMFIEQQSFEIVSLGGLKCLLQVILWGLAIFICAYSAVSAKKNNGEKKQCKKDK